MPQMAEAAKQRPRHVQLVPSTNHSCLFRNSDRGDAGRSAHRKEPLEQLMLTPLAAEVVLELYASKCFFGGILHKNTNLLFNHSLLELIRDGPLQGSATLAMARPIRV